MRFIKRTIILSFVVLSFINCDDYIDVVPDNVADIDYAFRMRSTAEKYLATCYSYLPLYGNYTQAPGLFGADELWLANFRQGNYINSWDIGLGLQNASSPKVSFWTGGNSGSDLWEGISQCNIFLENIHDVPDMEGYEREQWAAEVKFLKAYYHFLLVRNYGPIPIIHENIPISSSEEEVRLEREPVDSVFNFISNLIDEAAEDLPISLDNESAEYGRITLPIALGYKAKILTYAASPLFNGNQSYANFTDKNGKPFFNQDQNDKKWKRAVDALVEAIDLAENQGYTLYEFESNRDTQNVSDSLKTTLGLRGIVTDRWNDEIIWADPKSTSYTGTLQEWIQPRALSEEQRSHRASNGSYGVPMNMAELFYTEHGLPIDEDKSWDYNNRYDLKKAGKDDRYYIKEGEETAILHFDREPRFYSNLGFDRGIWFGQGNYDEENPYWLELKVEEFAGKIERGWHSVTGYYPKKLINFTNDHSTANDYSSTNYPWPLLRLGDLYLLYAEALNELDGPGQEVYDYIDRIRYRAGLGGVVESWGEHSANPDKPQTKEGLREIIQQERTVELAFEGERFWDLRRWKTAEDELNKTVNGWDVDQETTEGFYRVRPLFEQEFQLKDYFWPIEDSELLINENLIQNPGW